MVRKSPAIARVPSGQYVSQVRSVVALKQHANKAITFTLKTNRSLLLHLGRMPSVHQQSHGQLSLV